MLNKVHNSDGETSIWEYTEWPLYEVGVDVHSSSLFYNSERLKAILEIPIYFSLVLSS